MFKLYKSLIPDIFYYLQIMNTIDFFLKHKRIRTKTDNTDENKLNEINKFDELSRSRLPREFFMTDVVDLSKKLLGKIFVRKIGDDIIKARIVETEAYKGPDDKGAHCYNNKKTERTKYFWEIGGKLYVYMIHNHNCLNIVADEADKPEATLIRAVEIIEGVEKVKELRGEKSGKDTLPKLANLANGPGKVGKALNVDRSYNAVDLCSSDEIFIIDDNDYKFEMDRSIRINIDYAEEYIYKPWRFFIKGNKFVSKVNLKHEYKDD
jgi:DNA-3-methyladenine glycosylase